MLAKTPLSGGVFCFRVVLRMDELTPWRIAGTYLESCNCEAICPCRRIGGRQGGDSTYRECLGSLSWQITEGAVGDVDVADLGVVIANRYRDDEPGSPWSFFLYLDDRATPAQHEALTAIYTGALGGTPREQFPWAFKPSDLLGVKPARIEIDHTPGKGWFRAAREVAVRVREPVADQETVTCVIPGHHRTGREVVVDLLYVDDQPLAFEFSGNCGYESTFEYSS
jgi:hypothetical protein